MKHNFCQYVKGATDDAGTESLRLYLPDDSGHINYNIVHSVSPARRCDTWRLSVVYLCDGQRARVRPLTRAGAEWEMALKIKERPDFIGGFAHGDERLDGIVLTLDGEQKNVEELCQAVSFDRLTLEVWSCGYDPSNTDVKTLSHYKKIIADSNGIRVEQRIEWLGDYELGRSYMAMFAPLKSETDSYYTASDSQQKPIGENAGISSYDSAGKLYLTGKNGLEFCLKVDKYLSDPERGHEFLISDNGGVPYNKMYFALCHNGEVKTGDVWETVTVYSIKKKS